MNEKTKKKRRPCVGLKMKLCATCFFLSNKFYSHSPHIFSKHTHRPFFKNLIIFFSSHRKKKKATPKQRTLKRIDKTKKPKKKKNQGARQFQFFFFFFFAISFFDEKASVFGE
jgi:predicted GIY-YIG superfamily endonuclease